MKLEHVLATHGIDVFTISPGASINEAIAELAARDVGALVVVDETGAVVGIISERDIIREMARSSAINGRPVRDLMTPDPITASPADDADAVLRTMLERHFRHVPVVDAHALVGIVTIGDLEEARLLEMEGAVDTLETQLLNQ